MAWGSRPDGSTSGGLVSLPSTLLAGTLVLVVVAAVALVPVGSFSVGGLVVTDPVADATAEPADAGDREVDERAGLEVDVRGPRRLVPRHPAPLEVRVRDHGGSLRLEGRRLLLTFELELDPEARGWVVIDPARLLVRADELDEQRIELRGFGELPCGEDVGTLSVRAQELVEDGRTATTELTVPGRACDRSVPAAPDTVHQLEAPTPTPPASSTRPAPRPSHGGSSDDEAEDTSTESDPPDGDDEAEPEDAGDDDRSPPGDTAEEIVDPDGEDDSDSGEADGGGDSDGDAPSDDTEGDQDAAEAGGAEGGSDGAAAGDTDEG